MGGADVGGDGSVQWRVWGDNIKPGKEVVRNRGTKGEHQNVDTTDPGTNFTVSIELPQDQAAADAIVSKLKDLPYPAVTGSRVTFDLPIVPKDPDQISVRWNSSAAPAGKATMTVKARSKADSSVKKSTKKKAKKKRK